VLRTGVEVFKADIKQEEGQEQQHGQQGQQGQQEQQQQDAEGPATLTRSNRFTGVSFIERSQRWEVRDTQEGREGLHILQPTFARVVAWVSVGLEACLMRGPEVPTVSGTGPHWEALGTPLAFQVLEGT
jgi:hypothetical protein